MGSEASGISVVLQIAGGRKERGSVNRYGELGEHSWD